MNKLGWVQNLGAGSSFENLIFLISFRNVLLGLDLLSVYDPTQIAIFILLVLVHIQQLLKYIGELLRYFVHINKDVLNEIFANVDSSQKLFVLGLVRKPFFEIIFVIQII